MPRTIRLLSAALLACVPARAETVVASWYGPGFHGRVAASGCVYDQWALTAASRDLPLGAVIEVSRAGKRVLLLVTDRGPYVRGRSLDLSRAAAARLGMVRAGVARVEVQVVDLRSLTCRRRVARSEAARTD